MKHSSQSSQTPHEVELQERRNEREAERRKLSVLMRRLRAKIHCLECGLEFPYSWELMRSVRATAADDTDAPSTRAGHTEVSIA